MRREVRKAGPVAGRWEGVDAVAYKAEGSAPFRDVTRQVLFDDEDLPCQLRYFHVAAGGWSTCTTVPSTVTYL